MPCIDTGRRARHLSWATLALLAACSAPPAPPPAPPAAPVARSPAAPAPAARPAVPQTLPAARNWSELRELAARRIVAANPTITHTGKPQDILLAVPVLEIELNADGSVRHIDVMRYPRQARDTVKIAEDAVRRAAPFGDVSRLPKPWKFTETFLFDDDRRFKPRTLD